MSEQTLLRMGNTDFTGLRGWNPQAPQLSVEEHRRMREREGSESRTLFVEKGREGVERTWLHQVRVEEKPDCCTSWLGVLSSL